MNNIDLSHARDVANEKSAAKFLFPDITAKGEQRATVALKKIATLWINTGTLCNIECVNCYIESSPTNDRLEYINRAEAKAFFEEANTSGQNTTEIGFTGGEPFLNPDMLAMIEDALSLGFEVLVLTNAMAPMQRPHIKHGLIAAKEKFGSNLTLRISLDHHSEHLHDTLRGRGSFKKTIEGVNWLTENHFKISLAGRTCWDETEDQSREGYKNLIERFGWTVDPQDREQLILFPEMDEKADVPEITTACWSILGIDPDEMMCASSRMIVKRKNADSPTVVPCTLLPYDQSFDMGKTLAEAAAADGGMFSNGSVKLCHPHCSKFCVLGGGSCSG